LHRIQKELSKIEALRAVKINYRTEVDTLQKLVQTLGSRKLTVDELAADGTAEIDQLTMQRRDAEEKRMKAATFGGNHRDRELIEHLENLEANNEETVGLIAQNQAARRRLMDISRAMFDPKRPRRRTFTLGKQRSFRFY
jgi:hypothetical protein